jgi:hypothetical protein
LEKALAARPDQDVIQGIAKNDLLPVDPHVPQRMTAGEKEAREQLVVLRDEAETLSTAFMASEERVSALEAKATKKVTKNAKPATQTKDALLSESEEEGSSEASDMDEDELEPPKKAAKLGMLSDVMIRKIMKVNLSRDWTSDVNKTTFKFNKSIYNSIRSAVKLIKAKKPSQGRDILLRVNQKLGERQRMVLLADNSEAGWMTVKNYEGDDWALSSKDQLKMTKAETKAMKTLESQVALESAVGASTLKAGYTKPAYGRVNIPNHKAALPKSAGTINVQGDTVPNATPVKKATPAPTKKTECFNCGSVDHWRNQCPHPLKPKQ